MNVINNLNIIEIVYIIYTFNIINMLTYFILGSLFPNLIALIIFIIDKLISKEYHQEYDRLFNEGVKLLEVVGIPAPRGRMKKHLGICLSSCPYRDGVGVCAYYPTNEFGDYCHLARTGQ